MPIVVDEEISALDLVVGEISQDSIENTRGESLPVEDDEIPLSVFEEEESDDEEGELNWTDMIGIAVGQINSEPEDAILDANIPRFRHEEDEIKKQDPIIQNVPRWFFDLGVPTQARIPRLVPSVPIGLHNIPCETSSMGGLTRDACKNLKIN
ncbi:hypothetical protein H4Q26_002244 [Puccinia striiformis f. sp. tritici PST-130]|nr:hypothetical protein H4Q26_002244 [Puccinia striiformis f. sp. tritici PST-130]